MLSTFLKDVKAKYVTQDDNIRWILIIEGEAKELSEILSNFDVGQYRIKFTHMEGSLWYAKVGGHPQVITAALRRKLGHSNFVLAEIVGVPITLRVTDPNP